MELFGYEIRKKERVPGVVYMSDVNKSIDRKYRMERLKEKAAAGLKFVEEHGAAIGSAVAGLAYGGHKLHKYIEERDDTFRRDRTVYDPSKKQRLTLRRKMNRKELYQYIERRDRGEKVYDILKDMSLLK